MKTLIIAMECPKCWELMKNRTCFLIGDDEEPMIMATDVEQEEFECNECWSKIYTWDLLYDEEIAEDDEDDGIDEE